MEEYCINLTIITIGEQSGQLTGLEPGLYTVKNMTEVESDGSMTLHRRTDALQLNITEPPPTTAPTGTNLGGLFIANEFIIDSQHACIYYKSHCLTDSPSVGEMSASSSAPDVGPIVGGIFNGEIDHSH
jgi:hypothetical protein